jgi:hypothetical protein
MSTAERTSTESAGTIGIAEATWDGSLIRIRWRDGHRSAFPSIWLRDNCPCPLCRDPGNGQRLLDTANLPDTFEPARLRAAGDGLAVTWAPDAHESRYPATWLAAHDLAPEARAARRPQPAFGGRRSPALFPRPIGRRSRQGPPPSAGSSAIFSRTGSPSCAACRPRAAWLRASATGSAMCA